MRTAILALLVLVAGACSETVENRVAPDAATAVSSTSTTDPPESGTSVAPATSTTMVLLTTTTEGQFARPDWLGTQLLPLRSDGHGMVKPTPPELQDRRLETIDWLAPPDGETFQWSIEGVSDEVLARSSWTADCPVGPDDLAYVKVAHLGFDGRFHTGEIIVHASVAEDVVGVFRRLHEARFPIEQMRVVTAEEVAAHPTGDWNDTTSFVCRPAVGSSSWSQHAFGLAVDINPFHNPYVKGDLVLPELASAYVDRDDERPGMIAEGDVVTSAFDAIGWGWGGRWKALDDWMHFSLSGR